jgi:hypothetical protein
MFSFDCLQTDLTVALNVTRTVYHVLYQVKDEWKNVFTQYSTCLECMLWHEDEVAFVHRVENGVLQNLHNLIILLRHEVFNAFSRY